MNFSSFLWYLWARQVKTTEQFLSLLVPAEMEWRRASGISSEAWIDSDQLPLVLSICQKVWSQSLVGLTLPVPEISDLRSWWKQAPHWRRVGYDFISPTSRDFPKSLKNLLDPPRGLFLWGQRQDLQRLDDSPRLAVVGSRRPLPESCSWMERHLLSVMTEIPDLVLLSGGARGIDQVAHRLCLRQARATVVFLPSGFDCIYPPELSRWSSSVLAHRGVFVSEYEPGFPLHKSHFSERNRLISGWGHATLIIEARRRSGTLLTARSSAEQGRAVFVVPGHPQVESFGGSLDLLREGATMVCDAQELSGYFIDEVRNSFRQETLPPTDRSTSWSSINT